MPLALPLPDGRFVTIREGETPEQTWARAQQMYPDAFATKQAPETSSGSGSGLGDIATAFKQGAVGSTKALTDVFGAQNAASASLGATSEALQKDYSPARQAELQAQAARMKEAEASGSTLEEIKAGAKNIFEAPVQSVAQGLGSLVPYVPTMFLGPLAGALRLARPTIAALESISAAAPKILGTAQGMGTVKGAVYDAVLQKETEAGVPPEVAKQKAESAQDYFGENADQIALGGVLGRVAGGSGIENLLTKPGAAAAAKGLTRRIATAAGTEAITEGPQGGQERLAANLAQQRAGYDVPTMQGVIGAGVQEGLTGALTAGPVAALRGPQTTATKTQEQTDIEQARAEEEARLKKDREYKATPQYQQYVVEQYETLAQQKQELISQKKKIGKGSLTEDADKAFNKDVELQLKTLQKQIDPLAKDYYQAKSFVTQQEKQAELAGMTPQEYMLQQMGAKPSATKVEPENDYVTMATQNKPAKVEPSAAQQYMQGQFQAAQGLVNDPGGYADYMMQDPQMAAQIVQNRFKIPELSASENNLLLSGISLRLKEQEKVAQRAAKQELGQRQADLQAQKLTTPKDQMALFNQSTEDVEKLRAEGETNFDYLDPMFETALAGQPPVVQVSDAVKPTDKAPLIRKQVESLMEMADQADKDYQTARSANQPDAARNAFERGNQAIEQIKTVSKEGGDYAREFLAARQAQNSAMAQLGDITEQLRTGQTLGGPNKEMAASTEQSLTNKANQVRAQLVAATLQEAAIHRRAAGNPAITQDEAIKAASVVHDAVNDWVERSKVKSPREELTDAQKNLEPTRQKVQKSGNTVSTYKLYDPETNGPLELTIIRQPDGTVFRVFSRYPEGGGSEFDNSYGKGITDKYIVQKSFLDTELFTLGKTITPNQQRISPAEAKHFQARVLAARNQLIAPQQTQAKRIETGILKRQFAAQETAKTAEARGETATTLGGELRRLREYVLNKVEKVLQTVDLPEGGARVVGGPDKYGRDERGVLREEGLRELMEQARDVLDTGNPSRELIDSIEAQADRLLRGEDLGTMTVTRTVVTDQGRKVARTREGEEASPVMVNRGRKFGQVAEEEARAPESRYTEELRAGLRAYQQGQGQGLDLDKDTAAKVNALRAEGKDAEANKLQQQSAKQTQAQQSLFPETNEEFGYIRATAANFAKSPRMKPVWEALDKARALFKKTEAARVQRSATVRARTREIESLQGRINSVTSSAEFIAARQEKWTADQLTNTFAAEKGKGLNPVARAALVQDAIKTLNEGRRLDDLDNRLLGFMQDTNKEISDAAKVMHEKTAPLRDAVAAIKKAMKTSPTVTAEEKALLAHEDEIKKQRGEYQRATENAIKKAREDMEAARAALLDPLIKQTSDALTKAEATLVKEKQALEKAKAGFEGPVEGSPQNRNQIRTYFLFKVEEKQGVIDDLTKQIEEQKDALEALVTQRYEEMDGAAAVAQAMLDKNVKTERTWLEMLEAQLAFVRGDDVLKKANSYPFAAERARISAKNQVQVVKAAEKRAEEFKAAAKTQQQEMEEYWQDKMGGEGVKVARKKINGEQRKAYEKIGADISAQTNKIAALKTALDEKLTKKERTAKETALKKAEEALASLQKEELNFSTRFYEVSKTLTKADKEAKRLHDEAIKQLDREEEAERRELVKDAQTNILAAQIADRLVELEVIPGSTDINELKKVLNSDTATEEEVINAQVRILLLQEIKSLEAQEEVLSEGKPRKKQSPATTLSSTAQAKGKPLRTGFVQVLEKVSEAVRSEKESGTYGEERFTGGEGAGESGIFTGGEERFFSRGKPAEGQTVASLREELRQVMGESVTSRGNVKIYNSVEDYIQRQKPELQDKLRQEIPPDAKGFAQGNNAVLFAENIGKGHGLGVLLHEIGVHVGFRNFFNEGQYKALVNQVKQWAQRTDGSIEEKVGKAAQRRVETANTDESQVDDELLAYAVEEAVQMGVNPEGIKGGSALRNWLNMVVTAFKKALNAFGVNPTNLQAGDLVNFAYGCAQLELKGTWHGTGAKFYMFDFDYMGKGEGAQVYSWGTYRAQRRGVAENYTTAEALKQVKEWRNLPEIKKWLESQKPKLIREVPKFIPDWMLESALDAATELDTGLSPHELFKYSIKNQIKELEDLWSDPTMQDVGFGIQTDAQFKNTIKKFKDFTEDAASYIDAPYDKPLYKGNDWGDLYKLNPAASKVLSAMANKNMDVKQAFAKAKQDAKESMDLFEGDTNPSYKGMYEKNKFVYENIDKLDLNDFKYNPTTAPPIPKPTGYLVRTLHTRPENTYLLWDAKIEKQSAQVYAALKNLYEDMPLAQRQKFLMLLQLKGATGAEFYETLAATVESQEIASRIMAAYGISGNKFLDGISRNKDVTKKSTYNYVDYVDKAEGPEIIAHNIEPVGTDKNVILLSRKAKYNNSEFEDASKVTSRIVAQNRSWYDKLKVNFTGLAFETQIVDRFAGFERLAKYMEPLKGTQMMFYLRQYDQRMNLVSDSVANGAPSLVEKTRKDGQIERMVESKDGASLSGVVTTLKDAKQYIGNGEAVNQMFTTYLAAIRAANKGIDSLNFGTDKDGKPTITQADLDKITKLVEDNKPLKDIFNKARSEYNEYNRNLIKFLVDTGALDQATANRLIREDDYIPFYRQRNGVAELLIGSESPINIGSIKEQPYLQELVGGDQPILDFMTSSVQNTNLLVDMGMRNLATRNAVMELVDLKAATLVKKASGPDVVKFKIDGSERYAIIHTEKVKIGSKEFDTGVPADILVKGMEGIPTQMPFLLRAMAIPAQILRKGIVVSPLYIGKQLFRDSLAAPIISGADFLPVIGALKELRGPAKRTLEKRGIVGGQQFKGTSEDLSMILRDMADDKPGWMFALGKLEAAGMEADALTRRAQYNSYIEQGLSEMEATLMALESMNFNKRGASPSIHVANALIPFFNAQIQGLNVMYKAMAGKMPFNDKLRIREKMLQRGALMAGITLAYAVHMEDDEAYKNATPDQKYGSWFMRVPGVDEPVRVPLPFEIGYVFKAIPEALYNSMTTEHGGEEAVKAFKQILLQTVPGGTSYGIPQFFKPAIEVGLGKSFYTGRDILSAREQRELPEQQYRNNTTEAAKYVGSSLGISPIKLEALISGYTGTLGLAFMQAISLGIPVGESPEKAVKRLSEYPIVGGLFQPNDAGGIINAVYERMNEAEQVRTTVRSLMKDGKITEANALLERRGNEYMQAEISDVFKSNMNTLTKAERAINASDMSAQEKREQLDEIRRMKIGLANAVREISDKTIHLTGFP